jgi:hypothetical protein
MTREWRKAIKLVRDVTRRRQCVATDKGDEMLDT